MFSADSVNFSNFMFLDACFSVMTIEVAALSSTLSLVRHYMYQALNISIPYINDQKASIAMRFAIEKVNYY